MMCFGCGVLVPKNNGNGGFGRVDNIPLRELNINATVLEYCGEVTMEQVYTNTSTAVINVVYRVELDHDAAVTSFVAKIGDRTVEAVLEERKAAADAFDAAAAAGNGAYMMTAVGDDANNLFQIEIGNLPPQETARITLSYATELDVEDDRAVFRLPGNTEWNAARDSVPVHISVVFAAECSISSDNHPTSFKLLEDASASAGADASTQAQAQARKTIVSYSWTGGDVGPLSKDFVLRITYRDPHVPTIRSERASDGTIVSMATFCPTLSFNEQQQQQQKQQSGAVESELVCLIDVSGSMSGDKIEHTKKCLDVVLASLTEGTYFNLVIFNEGSASAFCRSVPYNDANLDRARKWVAEKIVADGCTFMYNPLHEILRQPPVCGARQVFIMTDGNTEKADECIAEVKTNAAQTRVFTFGIGTDVDKTLVYDLAKAGNGKSAIILRSEDIASTVALQMQRAMRPALTNIVASILGATVTAPKKLPALFEGSRLAVFGFADPSSQPPANAKLEGALGTKQCILVADRAQDGSPLIGDYGGLVCKMGARALLRDLDADACSGSSSSAKSEAVRVSLGYGVLSKHTAFLAVDQQPYEVTGPGGKQPMLATSTREITFERVSKYKGMYGGGSRRMCCAQGSPASRSLCAPDAIYYDAAPSFLAANGANRQVIYRDHISAAPAAAPAAGPYAQAAPAAAPAIGPHVQASSIVGSHDEDAMQTGECDKGDVVSRLVRCQKANGSWSSADVCSVLHLSPTEFDAIVAAHSCDPTVFATIVSYTYMLLHPDPSATCYGAIISKTKKWLDSLVGADILSMTKAATGFLN